ncbi:MAG: hypothetical protein ABWZ93_07545 [Xanthobacteraceae bacterium]
MNTLTQARIRILGPDEEGGFVVEFCKHTGPKLVFVIPPNADNDVLAYFQERMPYGIAVPDIGDGRRLTSQQAAAASPFGVAGTRLWPLDATRCAIRRCGHTPTTT